MTCSTLSWPGRYRACNAGAWSRTVQHLARSNRPSPVAAPRRGGLDPSQCGPGRRRPDAARDLVLRRRGLERLQALDGPEGPVACWSRPRLPRRLLAPPVVALCARHIPRHERSSGWLHRVHDFRRGNRERAGTDRAPRSEVAPWAAVNVESARGASGGSGIRPSVSPRLSGSARAIGCSSCSG